MTEADEALVRRSQKGERPAFEELVRRTARLVFARMLLETRDPHRAEDLTQETYLSAWKSIGQVGDPKLFRGWLLSVAQSVLIDSIRHHSRAKRDGDRTEREALEEMVDEGTDPARAAELADERERALTALRGMPEEYRQVLMLRYLAGADYAEISKQLALTNGSLRGLLHRGMEMLRKRMRGCHGE